MQSLSPFWDKYDTVTHHSLGATPTDKISLNIELHITMYV